MAIEFFNFGMNTVDEVSKKLQKTANDELQKETDAMFERLHEDYKKKEEPQNNGYNPYEDDNVEKEQQSGYNPDDYERVGFSGIGSKNQALYFAQYMKDKGVNDVVVSPVKLNGEYMVEMPKQFTQKKKVKSEPKQQTTHLNHDEQDFLRKQLENVAAQEEAKKSKSVDNFSPEEQYNSYTDIQRDDFSSTEQVTTESISSEPPHSTSDDYNNYQQEDKQETYSTDKESSQNTDFYTSDPFTNSDSHSTTDYNSSSSNLFNNGLFDNNLSETQSDSEVQSSETKQDIFATDTQSQNNYHSDDYSKSYQNDDGYSVPKHDKAEDYIPKGFDTQQILPEQHSQEKEIKSNPFSSESASIPTVSPSTPHLDSQKQTASNSVSSYAEQQAEPQMESSANSQQTASYSPYTEFLSNYDNKEAIERIAKTGIVENDSDRKIMKEFVALSGSSFESSDNQDVNLTHKEEPQLTSVRFNDSEKNFIRDSIQSFTGENKEITTAFQAGMADYLSTHKDVADTMSKLAEKGKITTPQERQAFLDYQNAAQNILDKSVDAVEKSKIESQGVSIKSKAEFIRTENVTASLHEKLKASEPSKNSGNKTEYKNVTKTSQQMIAEFQQQFDVDVRSASLRGNSQRTEKLRELREEREEENNEYKSLTKEGKNLVNFTARSLDLFGSAILNADRIMTDLAQYDVLSLIHI